MTLSPRHGSRNRAGTFRKLPTAIFNQSKVLRSSQVSLMESIGTPKITTLAPRELLGPLNDVERKFAPSELFAVGPMEIPLPRPRVSIIGSRNASPEGLAAAAQISSALSKKGVIIVSGLAEGIDTSAHMVAIEQGGRTIAVLGTPLNRVYPARNWQLQREIMNSHLAISQFRIGIPVQRKNFVMRNRTMALISDASIIVEAGETSGSLHQGWEALRLGRSLFIRKSIISNTPFKWPRKMMQYGALQLNDLKQVLEVLPSSKRISQITVQI